MVQRAEQANIEVLTLNWADDEEQVLEAEVLCRTIQFIHDARQAGGSVLVHCAQGKSRSAATTVSYIAALEGISVDAALLRVKAQRRMAQPNKSFMRQLKAHDTAGLFLAAIHHDDAEPGRLCSHTAAGGPAEADTAQPAAPPVAAETQDAAVGEAEAESTPSPATNAGMPAPAGA